MGQIRALIFVPCKWKGPMEDFPELRPTLLRDAQWFAGPLLTLDVSGIPSPPFNRLIYFDLPPKLRNFHGYLADDWQERDVLGERNAYRASVNLISNPAKTGVDGIYCDAIEIFRFPLSFPQVEEDSETNLIALHLFANDTPTNLENFTSLTRLWNRSLLRILGSLFITPSD